MNFFCANYSKVNANGAIGKVGKIMNQDLSLSEATGSADRHNGKQNQSTSINSSVSLISLIWMG